AEERTGNDHHPDYCPACPVAGRFQRLSRVSPLWRVGAGRRFGLGVDRPARALVGWRLARLTKPAADAIDGAVRQATANSKGEAGRSAHCAVMPPSMTRPAPVIKAASSEARKTMPLAISVGAPIRPIGRRSMTCRRAISTSLVPRLRARVTSTWSPISVSIVPGWIELTRMRYPLRANSRAADFVNSVPPPLVIE